MDKLAPIVLYDYDFSPDLKAMAEDIVTIEQRQGVFYAQRAFEVACKENAEYFMYPHLLKYLVDRATFRRRRAH